jgi:hypothetical protein
LLNLLTKKRLSVAVVIDEYGGTAGIITIEDIVEELFGEIQDEHDDNEEILIENKQTDNLFLFSARHEVSYLNDTYNFDLEESDSYSTLGGFIVYHFKNIPEINQIIIINDYQFTIKEATNNKIDIVTFDYGLFPMVYKKTYRKTIFICMLNKTDFYICGVGSPQVINAHSKSELIVSSYFKSKGKAAFYGFDRLTPLSQDLGDFIRIIS